MLENFLGMFRKRRRLNGDDDIPRNNDNPTTARSNSLINGDNSENNYPMSRNLTGFWDSIFGVNSNDSDTSSSSNATAVAPISYSDSDIGMCVDRKSSTRNALTKLSGQGGTKKHKILQQEEEAMEIDPSPVPPPQEYSDSPSTTYQSELSMNFDYLQGLHSDSSAMDATTTSSTSRPQDGSSPRHFSAITASTTNCQVDDSRVVDRFVTVLDQLDARVEKFRKDALGLQEKRDFLLMSIDLIKSNDSMQNLTDSEREEIGCYLQRVNARLSTVELNVRTVRDHSQEDSLSQINTLIDLMITMGDPVLSRQRCQMYLNACCSAGEDVSVANRSDMDEYRVDVDVDAGPVDKKFESVLLGCTLDDQKNIKKRLHALMGYLNKQIIPR
uniref:BAG domain-containing protein n=1 Tax=Glossina palpalis gambiensis TaxID=67801 RepID=A0A1B0AWC1_9MUSC